jgi:hypothetical protein
MLVLLASVLIGALVLDRVPGAESPTQGPAIPADPSLAAVRTVDVRPDVPGYDRGCGAGEGCVFGPSWTDDHAGVDGHDGCDTRNNVLQRQLHDLRFRPGTHDCVVVAGTLDDPYTGRVLTFAKAEASKVQIDHLFPLALAWDMGASTWTRERRVDFANDVALNLLAVDGGANASKGDRGPGEWMPIARGFRCEYVERFVRVAVAYDLAITTADADSVRHTLGTC